MAGRKSGRKIVEINLSDSDFDTTDPKQKGLQRRRSKRIEEKTPEKSSKHAEAKKSSGKKKSSKNKDSKMDEVAQKTKKPKSRKKFLVEIEDIEQEELAPEDNVKVRRKRGEVKEYVKSKAKGITREEQGKGDHTEILSVKELAERSGTIEDNPVGPEICEEDTRPEISGEGAGDEINERIDPELGQEGNSIRAGKYVGCAVEEKNDTNATEIATEDGTYLPHGKEIISTQVAEELDAIQAKFVQPLSSVPCPVEDNIGTSSNVERRERRSTRQAIYYYYNPRPIRVLNLRSSRPTFSPIEVEQRLSTTNFWETLPLNVQQPYAAFLGRNEYIYCGE